MYHRASDALAHESDKEFAQEFATFVARVRNGNPVTNSDLIKFSKMFEDDFTLDGLSREQLVAMCKYLSLPAFGTDPFLRWLIHRKLKQIRDDDKVRCWPPRLLALLARWY